MGVNDGMIDGVKLNTTSRSRALNIREKYYEMMSAYNNAEARPKRSVFGNGFKAADSNQTASFNVE